MKSFKKHIKTLTAFIENVSCKTCLIVGPSGCGKTKLVYDTLSQMLVMPVMPVMPQMPQMNAQSHKHIVLDMLDLEGCTHSDIVNRIDTAIFTFSIADILNKTRRIIVIDDIDIAIINDRFFSGYVFKLLSRIQKSQGMVNKLCIICGKNEEKKMNDMLNKIDVIIHMEYLSEDECVSYLRYIRPEVTNERLVKFVNDNNCNVRDMILNLPNLDTSQSIFQYKQKNDETIYQACHNLFLASKRLSNASNASNASTVSVRKMDNLTLGEPIMSHILFDNMWLYLKKSRMKTFPMGQLLQAYVCASILENESYIQDIHIYNLPNVIKCFTMMQCFHDADIPVAKATLSRYKFTQLLTKTATHYNIQKKTSKMYASETLSGFGFFIMSTSSNRKCIGNSIEEKKDYIQMSKHNENLLSSFPLSVCSLNKKSLV